MTDKNNITLSQVSNENLLSSNNLAELGIQIHRPASHPEYSSFISRLSTFELWPVSIPQKPELLAVAGFYYFGMTDHVKCFHCGISLCKWEPTDDPWVEHARWYPTCAYISLILSKEFIKLCVYSKNDARNLKLGITSSGESDVGNPGARIQVYDPSLRIAGNPVGATEESLAGIYTDIPFADLLRESRSNSLVNETSFSTPESTPPPQCTSSTSSPHRYSIDDAAIDEVTMAILRSALFDENIEPQISSPPPANLSESENNDTSSTENSDYVIVSNEESNEDISNGNIPVENKTENNTIQPEKTEINQEECQKCKPMSLEEENKMLKKARMCKICMDSEVNIVFLPCGHLVSCTACAAGLLQCPICRASIKGVVRTYLS